MKIKIDSDWMVRQIESTGDEHIEAGGPMKECIHGTSYGKQCDQCVICPSCVHQFCAIPVATQDLLRYRDNQIKSSIPISKLEELIEINQYKVKGDYDADEFDFFGLMDCLQGIVDGVDNE